MLVEIDFLVLSFPGKFLHLKRSFEAGFNDNLFYFSWQLWEVIFFFFWWIRAILVAPFKSAVHLALIAEYLDSETHCINGCLFSSLTSLSKIFP